MNSMELDRALAELREETFAEFQRALIPTVSPERILGVRTPRLRMIASGLEDREVFLSSLPHTCFEENQIHGFLLEKEKDFGKAVKQVEAFLPYIDNWATCDQWRPRVFNRHREELLPYIRKWLCAEHSYTVRFGIKMLMDCYLDGCFSAEYPDWVCQVRFDDYYVKMMAAWYFATALAKQYDAALPYITGYRLEPWTHNKAIQKALESRRIAPEQKLLLKQYRIK